MRCLHFPQEVGFAFNLKEPLPPPGPHRDQGRGRIGLEGSPRSTQLWIKSLPSQCLLLLHHLSPTSSPPTFRQDSLFIFPTRSGKREPLWDFLCVCVVARCYSVCMFSKASGHRVRQARASVQQPCCELPSARVAHCPGTLTKYSGFHLIAQNAPEIARSGGKVQCRR